MKSYKKLIGMACLLAGFILSSCNDVLTSVGSTIQPEGDLISVYTDTFNLKASTIKLDSVYAKTSETLLGQMYDPLYGNIKSDFLCQFYCEDNFSFPKTPYNDKIDSIELLLVYPSSYWYGDSLAPMQAVAYPIVKPLKKNFYTNDNPELYCNMDNILGQAAYTPYNMLYSDSLRALSSYNYDTVRIKLPDDLGQMFYEKSVNDPASFANQAAFNEFFPGVYITTRGTGNIIRMDGDGVALKLYYHFAEKDALDQDSLVAAVQYFVSTKEVIQITRISNENLEHLFENNPDYTYVKSPSGIITKLVVPTTEISETMDVNSRYINDFTLNMKFLPKEEWSFSLNPPSYLLLLPEDSVRTFFESGSIENNTTIFLSNNGSSTSGYGYFAATRTYYFGNISSLLKNHIKNSPDKDLNILLIPVARSLGSYSSGYSSTIYYTTGITNSLLLEGVKIRTEEEFMKVVVISSQYENK